MVKKESQKKQIERAIMKTMPESALTWLKMPNNITFMRGDLTKAQLVMMNEIVDKLQGKMDERLKKGENTLFTDEDFIQDKEKGMIFPVTIRMSEIVAACKYGDLEAVAQKMAGITVKVRSVHDGVEYNDYMPIFDTVRIPTEETNRRNKNGKKYRRGELTFLIKKAGAEQIWKISSYTKFLKEVAKNCNSQFTVRIYMLIASQKRRGHDETTWVVGYPQLHSMFGFSVYKEATKTSPESWEINKYPRYKDFKKRVLVTSHEELKAMVANNCIDCYFEYREIYKDGARSGEPVKIEFRIILTELGKKEDDDSRHSKECIQLKKDMAYQFGFSKSDCDRIGRMLTEENIERVRGKVKDLSEYIETHAEIKDKKAYAWKVVWECVTEDVEPAEEVGDAGGVDMAAEAGASDRGEGRNSASVGSDGGKGNGAGLQKEAKGNKEISQEDVNLWEKCRDIWVEKGGNDMYSTYLTYIELVETGEDRVVISFPNRIFVDKYNNEPEFGEVIEEGMNVFGNREVVIKLITR